MAMQVILREDVDNLGRAGELVSVAPGYARNFLIPKGLAVLATSRNKRQMDHEKRVIEQHTAKMVRSAEEMKARLEQLSLTIAKQAGEEGKLFGSVTTREIGDALKDEGLEVDKKKIRLDEAIKSLGVYTVEVRLTSDILAQLKLWVVAK